MSPYYVVGRHLCRDGSGGDADLSDLISDADPHLASTLRFLVKRQAEELGRGGQEQ
jgi:hypothetical protein